MILTSVDATYYRVHSPRWAYKPTSGEGAAREGSRVNRKAAEALYVSADAETALAEYQQALSILPPGTIVCYHVKLKNVIDFRRGFDAAQWHPLWADFYADWRADVANGIEPITWQIFDLVQAAGMQGILFESRVRPGGTNLVIYNATLTADDVLKEHDPTGALPKSQASWK